MPKVEYWYKQDLKKPVKPQTYNGSVFTLDNVGSLVGVEVYSDGEPVTLTGTVNGYVILPDEKTTVPVSGTRSENKAYIALPQSALAYPGFIKITIKLTNSSEITTLLKVVAIVEKSRTDTVITPSSQIITDWSQQIAAEMQSVEDASAAQDVKINDLKSAFTNYVEDGNYTRFYTGTDIDTKFLYDFNTYGRDISYTIPAYTSVSQGTTFAIQWVDANETNHDIYRVIGGNPSVVNGTYTLPLETKKIRIRIIPYVNSGNTIPITVSFTSPLNDKIAEIEKQLGMTSIEGKNKLFLKNPTYESGLTLKDGKITNTLTDSKEYYTFKWFGYDANGNQIDYSYVTNVSSPTRVDQWIYFNKTCKSIKIIHNGSTRDLEIKFNVDLPADYYVLSLDVEECDPTTAGGIVLNNIQLEAGKQSTDYSPYLIPSSYEISEIINNEFYTVTRWESGSFDTTGYVADNKRCRTSPFFMKKDYGIHIKPNGQYFDVYKCGLASRKNPSEISKLSPSGWSEDELYFTVGEDAYIVVTACLIKDWSQAVEISPSDILVEASIVSPSIYAKQLAEKNRDAIEQLDPYAALPAYYKAEVDDTLNKLSKLPSDNFNYVILTDIHYSYPEEFTADKLGYLMESITRIANGGNIDAVLMLGDLIEGGYDANRQTSDNQINDVFAGFSDVKKPVLSAYGNHDQNMYNFSNASSNKKNTTYYITLPEWKNKAVFPFGFDNDYYYLDVPKKNIRLIIANTFEYGEQIDGSGNVTWPYGSGNRVSKTQLDALAEMMDGTDFDIVVATHGLNTDLLSLVSTFNTRGTYTKANSETISFANKTNSIRMYHTGHYHNAAMEYCSTYNVNVISTSCASMAAAQQAIDGAPNIPYITTWEDTVAADYMHRVIPRTKGTVNETCFDIVSIGSNNVTKIGFGASADDTISN